MSRTRSFVSGVALTYVNQIFVMVVGLWLTPFLLGHLGQRDFGLWLIGLKALSYLSLLDIGVLGLLPREVAFAKGAVLLGEPPTKIKLLVEETAFVLFTQLPLILVATVIAWFLMPQTDPVARNSFGILLVVFAVQFPLRIGYAVLEGLQELGFLGFLQLVGWAAGLAVNVALVYWGKGLYGLALGWATTQAVISLGAIWKLYLTYSHFAPRRLRKTSWTRYKNLLGAGLWISVGQLAQFLRTSDFLLIGKILGPRAVVPYSCTGKLVAIGQNQPQAIMQSAQPALSELRVAADRRHVARVVGSLTQAMLLLSGLVSVVIITVNRPFVIKWVGSAQYLGIVMTALLLLDMLCRHWNVTTVYSLFAFGHQRHISTVAVIDGAVTAAVSAALIVWLGPIGAPLGSLLTVVAVSLPWNLITLARELQTSVLELLQPVIPWALRFLPVAVLLGALGTGFLPASYFMVIAGSVAAVLIYAFTQWKVCVHSALYEYAARYFRFLERPARKPELVAK